MFDFFFVYSSEYLFCSFFGLYKNVHWIVLYKVYGHNFHPNYGKPKALDQQAKKINK